jgi:Holliday junction resolvase RusA-like endonuclease
MITVELPGVPQGKGRPRFVRATGAAYTPAKTRSYESMLQGAAIQAMAGAEPMEGPLRVRVDALFPVPASWSKSKRAAALLGVIRPTGRPDWENIAKVLDAFNCVVWKDDAQVVEGAIFKRYSETPRLIVRIARLEAREYDGQADLAGSIKEGFAAIRDRVAAGGPGWQRREASSETDTGAN